MEKYFVRVLLLYCLLEYIVVCNVILPSQGLCITKFGVPRDGRRVLGGRGSPVIAPLPHLAHNSIFCLNNRVLEFLGALLPQGSRWQDGKTHSFGAFQYVRPEDATRQ